jgi:phage baseplate assembly protein W
MPIPQTTRVNPLDLQGNIAIGVSLPFNGPSGPFNSTYSTADQIKSNLINLLLTDKGERVFNPQFGTDLRIVLFEGITDDTNEVIKRLINTNVAMFIPSITVTNIDIVKDEDHNKISIAVYYKINISGKADQITVQFI